MDKLITARSFLLINWLNHLEKCVYLIINKLQFKFQQVTDVENSLKCTFISYFLISFIK